MKSKRLPHVVLFISLALTGLFPALGFANQKFIVTGKSSVSFIARITGGSFVTESSHVEGYMELDDAGKQLLAAEIAVPVNSLDSGMSLRNHHMQDKYLEAPKFPKIIFTAKNGSIVLQSGAQNKLAGEFAIKDVHKPMTMDVLVKQTSASTVEVSTEFPINIVDYGIEQPSFAIVKMDPVVKITVQLKLERKQ